MAYYTALINAWNAGTVPSGYTGTALSGTTAQKLVQINGWTKTGTVPTSFFTTGAALLNCINWTEFNALTAAQQLNLLTLCAAPGSLLGGSGQTSHITAGMFLAYFTNVSGPTIIALTALAQAAVTNWWADNGYSSPFNTTDLVAAGGLT